MNNLPFLSPSLVKLLVVGVLVFVLLGFWFCFCFFRNDCQSDNFQEHPAFSGAT